MATDPLTSEPGEQGPRPRTTKRPDPFAELWAEAAGTDEADRPAATTTTEAPAVRANPPRRTSDRPAAPVERAAPDTASGGRSRRVDRSAVDTADGDVTESPGRRGRRPKVPIRARQVQRIIRRVDAWSVLKTSLFFYLSVWLIVLLAGTILWLGAASTGMIDNIEKFIRELGGWEVFEFQASQLLRGVGLGGLLVVIFGSIFTALLSVIFNLIADLTGGIRVHVVEVERVRRPTDDPTGERRRPV